MFPYSSTSYNYIRDFDIELTSKNDDIIGNRLLANKNSSSENKSPKRHITTNYQIDNLFRPKVSRSVSNDSMLCHNQTRRIPYKNTNLVTSFYDLTMCHPRTNSQYVIGGGGGNGDIDSTTTTSRFSTGYTIDRRQYRNNTYIKSSSSSSSTNSSKNLWTCTNCTLENSTDIILCAACDTPRRRSDFDDQDSSPIKKQCYYRRSLSESPSAGATKSSVIMNRRSLGKLLIRHLPL